MKYPINSLAFIESHCSNITIANSFSLKISIYLLFGCTRVPMLRTCWMVNCDGQEFIIYFLPFFIANLFSSLLIIDHNIVTEKGPNRWTHLYIIRFDLMSINFFFHSSDFSIWSILKSKMTIKNISTFFVCKQVNRFTKLSRCQNENKLKSAALLSFTLCLPNGSFCAINFHLWGNGSSR